MTEQASTPLLRVGYTISACEATPRGLASIPSNDRRTETQAFSLEADRQLSIEQGIIRTNVKDLCSLVGFNHSTFYSNFFDMEHFIEHLVHEQRRTITGATDEPLEIFLDSERLPLTLNSKNATELASRFFEVISISCAFHLFHTEVVGCLVRNYTAREEVYIGCRALKEHLGRALNSALGKTGRHCALFLTDAAELFLAHIERSVYVGLTKRNGDLEAYIERITSMLLV